MLAFGDMKDTDEGKATIAASIVRALEQHGFEVDWSGSVQTKINVPEITWQRRST